MDCLERIRTLLEERAALSPAQKRLVLELVHQLGRP